MTNRFRSLNRFAIALALVGVLVGARAGVQMFAAPTVTFNALPDLNFNQGQPVTVAFAAQGFPTDVVYTAEGLPPGLSMSMGIDTLGHVIGLMSGTLAPDTPTASGSEGVYNVRVHASDGAVSNFFKVDVSHWNRGDVFVGGGQWVYQVYREDGTFKTDVTIPDDPSLTFGSTTGCAVNWSTGEVWATNFDDVYPALNVITRHAGSNPLPYTDPSRRLSTERYGVGNVLTPFPGNENPFDINPQDVAFNDNGDMLVGHSFGYFNDNGDEAAANGTPTVLDDPIGGWVYVDAAGQPLLDIAGNMIPNSANISPAGFFEKWILPGLPTNILGPTGQPIPVPLQGGMDLHRYTPDANGNYHSIDRQFYDVHYGYTGIDTIDLLSDQKTLNYSSEDWYIYRYDISAGAQMPVVGSNVLGESRPISTRAIYGIRTLPPGDGTGGYLAVNEFHIDRLDGNGNIVQSYDVRDDPDYPGDPDAGWAPGDVNGWFSIAIAPSGRTFWAATRQDVFQFDIASGAVIGQKIRATIGTLHTNAELAGLCVMDEYRAAQENCGPTGLGNGIDDDHDGTIDEGCFRVEICSPFSPGDDDGDGLIDYNDPDCGAPPSQQCVIGGPTDNSVAGICDRADYEGDTIDIPGIPPPCSLCDDWTFTYSATGLPAGLTMNPTTGEVTGIPFFSIVNPNSPTSPPVVSHVTVNSTWQKVGAPPSSFTKTFDWTISNRNRVPVAVDDGTPTVNTGGTFSFDVRANDSDIDGDTITINSFTQPPAGQGTVAEVGQNLVYTAPSSGFAGTTSFTYTIKDTYTPAGISNVATVTVKVNGVPVAVDDAFTTLEDTPLAATLVLNDTPSSDGGNVWSKTSNPANGVVTVFQGGTFTYTPNANFNGTDSFTYKICDINNDCSNATARITITPVNDLPIAVSDAFSTNENTPVSSTLTGNDTPSGDGGNVWSRVTNGLFGNAVVNADGTFTYTPNTGFFGVDTFTYKLCDVDNDCSIATVTITILHVNNVPVAVNDAFTIAEDTPLNSTVVTNDTLSADGGNVFTKVSNPTHGTATVNPDGTFNYTPDANYNGTDAFIYKICDRDPDCATATVTITITPVNDLPIAVSDAFSTNENTAVSNTLKTNDTLSGDGGNVWSKVSNPANGTATVNADGTFTYTPNTGFSGVDTFTYKLCDVDNDCSTATVTITIIRLNAVPVAVNDVFTIAEDTPLNSTVVTNDTLSSDGGNVFTKVTNPLHGTATVNLDGTFNYTPDPNYNGSDVFIYKLCDRDPDCATATVTITITPVNDVPVAVNDAFTTAEDTPVSGTLKTNDTPSGDGGNVWSKVTNPARGTATVNADGTFIYTPAANYNGTDSFTYKICDVDNDCSTATVTITITPVNDVPIAVNDNYTTAMNTPVVGTAQGNDTPSGDGGNVWTKVTDPSHGTVTMTLSGAFTYTPAAGYAGPDSFTYKVCDVDGDCSTATVTIRINGVPVAVNDTYTTPKNTALTASVATNDTPSVDGGNVWTMTAAPASGTVVLNANGTFTYTPATGFTGTVSFNYKVCDVDNDCATAIATIKINDAPLAVNDSYTTPKNTPLTGSVTGNDTPSADGGNVWTVTAAPTSGTVVLSANGTFTYTPALNFTGTVTFTYKVCDVDNDCATAIATIRINDVPVAVNDAFTAPQDTAIAGTLTGNDTPSADGGNVWTKTSNPLHGTAAVNPDGTFTYVPAAGFYGADSFTYKVCDVDNDCSTATVTITITRVNHVPIASGDVYTTLEDTPFTDTVIGNDQLSPDGGNVWSLVTGVSHGTLTFNANGTFTYAPAANYNGTDSFTYKLCDVDGDCSTAVAVITITPVNDVPVASNDNYSMTPNTTLSKDVSANDTLSGDGGNVFTKLTNPASGTVVFNSNGTFTYTPVTNFSGTVSFTYKLCDANNDCSTATVTITIAPLTTGALCSGDTATIGFWHNGNGQALIKKMNGSASATNLGNWLAATYPYLFGAQAGTANNMTGKTNTQVAAYDLQLFSSNKWLNQVLGGAIASYVTSSTLSGGNYAVSYGFNYSSTGTGTKTYNIGSSGTAVGLSNNTSYTVGQLLQQANLRKQQGTYDSNAFNVIFSGINQTGDIQ
jgi:VCBS repeat-containing protein